MPNFEDDDRQISTQYAQYNNPDLTPQDQLVGFGRDLGASRGMGARAERTVTSSPQEDRQASWKALGGIFGPEPSYRQPFYGVQYDKYGVPYDVGNEDVPKNRIMQRYGADRGAKHGKDIARMVGTGLGSAFQGINNAYGGMIGDIASQGADKLRKTLGKAGINTESPAAQGVGKAATKMGRAANAAGSAAGFVSPALGSALKAVGTTGTTVGRTLYKDPRIIAARKRQELKDRTQSHKLPKRYTTQQMIDDTTQFVGNGIRNAAVLGKEIAGGVKEGVEIGSQAMPDWADESKGYGELPAPGYSYEQPPLERLKQLEEEGMGDSPEVMERKRQKFIQEIEQNKKKRQELIEKHRKIEEEKRRKELGMKDEWDPIKIKAQHDREMEALGPIHVPEDTRDYEALNEGQPEITPEQYIDYLTKASQEKVRAAKAESSHAPAFAPRAMEEQLETATGDYPLFTNKPKDKEDEAKKKEAELIKQQKPIYSWVNPDVDRGAPPVFTQETPEEASLPESLKATKEQREADERAKKTKEGKDTGEPKITFADQGKAYPFMQPKPDTGAPAASWNRYSPAKGSEGETIGMLDDAALQQQMIAGSPSRGQRRERLLREVAQGAAPVEATPFNPLADHSVQDAEGNYGIIKMPPANNPRAQQNTVQQIRANFQDYMSSSEPKTQAQMEQAVEQLQKGLQKVKITDKIAQRDAQEVLADAKNQVATYSAGGGFNYGEQREIRRLNAEMDNPNSPAHLYAGEEDVPMGASAHEELGSDKYGLIPDSVLDSMPPNQAIYYIKQRQAAVEQALENEGTVQDPILKKAFGDLENGAEDVEERMTRQYARQARRYEEANERELTNPWTRRYEEGLQKGSPFTRLTRRAQREATIQDLFDERSAAEDASGAYGNMSPQQRAELLAGLTPQQRARMLQRYNIGTMAEYNEGLPEATAYEPSTPLDRGYKRKGGDRYLTEQEMIDAELAEAQARHYETDRERNDFEARMANHPILKKNKDRFKGLGNVKGGAPWQGA
jgi:hypothetical protein